MSLRASNILSRKNFDKEDVASIIQGIATSNKVRGSDYNELSFLQKVDRWDQFGQGRTDKMDNVNLFARLYQLWIGRLVINHYIEIQSEMIFIKPVDPKCMEQEIFKEKWSTTPRGLDIEPLVMYQELYFLKLWGLEGDINQKAITTIIQNGGTAEVKSLHSGKIKFERGLFLTCPDRKQNSCNRQYVYTNAEVRSEPDGLLIWESAGKGSATETSKRLTGVGKPAGRVAPNFSEYVAAFHNRAAYPPFQNGKMKKNYVVEPVDPLDQGTSSRPLGPKIIYLLSSNFLPAGNDESQIFSEPHKYDENLREYYSTHNIEKESNKTSSTNTAVAESKRSQKLIAGTNYEGIYKDASRKRYKFVRQLGLNVQAYRKDIINCLNDNGSRRRFKKIKTSPAGNCLFNAVMAGMYGRNTSDPNNAEDKWALMAREMVCKYYKEGKEDGRASFLEDREHNHNIAAKLQEIFDPFTNDMEFSRFKKHLMNKGIHLYIYNLMDRFKNNKSLSLYDELNRIIPDGNGQTYLKTLVKAYSEYMTYNKNLYPSFVYGTETELFALAELYQTKICVRRNPRDMDPKGTDSDEIKKQKSKCYYECYGSGPREVFVFYENIHYTALEQVSSGDKKSKNDNHNQGSSNSRYHGDDSDHGDSDSDEVQLYQRFMSKQNRRYHGDEFEEGPDDSRYHGDEYEEGPDDGDEFEEGPDDSRYHGDEFQEGPYDRALFSNAYLVSKALDTPQNLEYFVAFVVMQSQKPLEIARKRWEALDLKIKDRFVSYEDYYTAICNYITDNKMKDPNEIHPQLEDVLKKMIDKTYAEREEFEFSNNSRNLRLAIQAGSYVDNSDDSDDSVEVPLSKRIKSEPIPNDRDDSDDSDDDAPILRRLDSSQVRSYERKNRR